MVVKGATGNIALLQTLPISAKKDGLICTEYWATVAVFWLPSISVLGHIQTLCNRTRREVAQISSSIMPQMVYEFITVNVNSLAPGAIKWNFIYVIFNLLLEIDGGGISCDIVIRKMSQDLIVDKSILAQVLAWCFQATSHYLSQCWPRSMPPYGVIRPQWVKLIGSWEMW